MSTANAGDNGVNSYDEQLKRLPLNTSLAFQAKPDENPKHFKVTLFDINNATRL